MSTTRRNHVHGVDVLEPQSSLSEEQQRTILEAVEMVAARCPSVRACRVGRRVRHGLPGSEQGMRHDDQYALLLDFEDLQGLREYLTHPDHERLGSFFSRSASAAIAYDFELFEVGNPRG